MSNIIKDIISIKKQIHELFCLLANVISPPSDIVLPDTDDFPDYNGL